MWGAEVVDGVNLMQQVGSSRAKVEMRYLLSCIKARVYECKEVVKDEAKCDAKVSDRKYRF